jgi:hypothetical protein
MITNARQLVISDGWSTITTSSDLAKMILQSGWLTIPILSGKGAWLYKLELVQNQHRQLSDEPIHPGFVADLRSRCLARKQCSHELFLGNSSSEDDVRSNVEQVHHDFENMLETLQTCPNINNSTQSWCCWHKADFQSSHEAPLSLLRVHAWTLSSNHNDKQLILIRCKHLQRAARSFVRGLEIRLYRVSKKKRYGN